MLDVDILLLCCVIITMFVALIREWFVPELTVFFALSSLVLFNVLTPGEALNGFANTGVHTVALLFVIAAAVSKSDVLHQLMKRVLHQTTNLSTILCRLMIPISSLSAFMNNTPIVTMLIPTVQQWAISNKIKPSKLLIPLSYAAILGGTITLIGTSGNLVIHGLMLDKGIDGFSMFDFAYFGIPLTIVGILYMVLLGHRFLPDREHHVAELQDTERSYMFQFIVETSSPLIGKTIKEGMLRNLDQLFLIQVIREGKRIVPAPNDEPIHPEDILIFSGSADGLIQLKMIPGLSLLSDGKYPSLPENHALVEVVVSSTSSLVSKKINETNFREKYEAAIVAVQRKHKKIRSRIGDVVIKPGDTLLLLTGKHFLSRWSDSDDFYVLSPIKKIAVRPVYERRIVIGVLLMIVLGSAFQLLSIFKLCLIGVAILIFSNVLTMADVKKAINWNVIILMGSSIGIGTAVEKTGLAALLAGGISFVQTAVGLAGILVMFFIVTLILTEIISNLATAAFMFPIGYSISLQLQLDPSMLAMVTAIAASCSFLSPIGYQTNLLVYGPGGYKFTDYVKVGLPLTILCMIVTIGLSMYKWLM
ncbi:SLC13 family permease [Halalkalibacterium halodurans]|uniref:SLC13 family permease n=1 Tax=Halalkalibacterium halodurans TaxID=86665 RepID=UPI002E1F9CD4|nr:SLC13 family permease [Halalkalibacterium halodurans]MED4085653.1 SLC13 family permease [Halalkalibacterium halodurans]MED4106347.1 SLC13 family permease [Halalkalibacterium halodurans]MED4108543.1 SLC13 family permease [Halalkalibacterium halodurans]MED4147647.1 SLC13 family permease [Halalkalibacterium halodurans]